MVTRWMTCPSVVYTLVNIHGYQMDEMFISCVHSAVQSSAWKDGSQVNKFEMSKFEQIDDMLISCVHSGKYIWLPDG